MWMQKAQRITPWINYWYFILFLTFILFLSSVFSVLSYLLLLLSVLLLLYQLLKSIMRMYCGQDKSHWEFFRNRMASFRLGLLTFHCCWFQFAGWCFLALIDFGNKIIVFMLLGGAFYLWFVLGTRLLCSCCWVVLSTSDWFGGQDHCVHVAGWCFPPLIDLGDKIIVFMLLGGAFHLWLIWGTRSFCSCYWLVLFTSDLFWEQGYCVHVAWWCFPPLIDLGDKIIVFMLLGGAFHLWLIWGTRSLCSCCWVVLSSSDLFWEQDHCVHVAGWCFPPLICFGTKITVLCTSD